MLDKECAAIQLWANVDSVTVEITKSNSSAAPAKAARYRRNGETLLSFQQGTSPARRILTIPGAAILYAGVPASTTCESTYDEATMVEAAIALPLGYLAKAMPEGPDRSVSESRSEEVLVSPGRMYIDPGNYIQIKRKLKIAAATRPEQPGLLRFEVTEQAKTLFGGEPKMRYAGRWERNLATPFPEDNEPLIGWLVCPRSGLDLRGKKKIGELRAMRSLN